MRAVVYHETGPSSVLTLVERDVPKAGAGEVRVRIHLSGVNPTDWKAREGYGGRPMPFPEVVPNQDGAGIVDAVGAGVDPGRVGERVWIWEAAWGRPHGTAQEYVVLPSAQAVRMPDTALFELGASLGIPFLTAHRCLTVHEAGPVRLAPRALEGSAVLVAGGAGAVGNAAIQLARWAGATVITTVSSAEKAKLAAAAGAQHVINYREQDVAAEIHRVVPHGVESIVEVAPAMNAQIDAQVLAPNAAVAVYSTEGGDAVSLPARPLMFANARWQFVLVYTVPGPAKQAAIDAVSAAMAEGALRAGEDAGLPLHRFRLVDTAAAHDAVQAGAVGKVLIEV